MASVPFSTLTVDHAGFDAAKRMVGWSSSPAAVCIGTTTGFTLLDRSLPSLRTIGAVSVGPTQTVAVLGVPTSASPGETAFSLVFVAAGVVVHTSPRPVLNSTSAQSPLLVCCRIGALDMCFVSAVGTRSVSLYQRQRPEVLETVAMEDDIALIADGPFHGSIYCILNSGKVVVISIEETGVDNNVRLAAVAEVDTQVRGISAAKSAGKSLLWLLTNDGRLFAYQARPRSTRHDDEASPSRRRSVSVARGELFTLVMATFHDAAGAVEGNERLSGFTVPSGALLWADETSYSASVAVLGEEEGSVELTKITVDATLSSFVTSVAMELESKKLVGICAQPHQWDLLAIHPRKDVIERVSLEVGPVLAANAPMTNIGASGDMAIKALCSSVAWAPHEQLGLLRRRCEVVLDALERETTSITSAEQTRRCTQTLVALQHAALAFLKREHEDTDASIDPQNSVSHYLLRRLRSIYTRIAAHDLLIAAGITGVCEQPLEVVLALSNARAAQASSRTQVRENFYESFRMTATQEHPLATLERWGHPQHHPSLAVDVIAREYGIDLERTSINELIARFPTATSVTSDPATMLAVVLTYAVRRLAALPHEELTLLVLEFLRTLDVPSGLWSWAVLLTTADHGASSNEEQDPLPDCSCLESCMPLVPLLLPSLVDGLMNGGLFEEAQKLGCYGLSVYAPQQLPHGLGSKLLLLAYRGGDAALITQIALRSRGTALSSLAVRVVALVSETLESLCMADGLYESNSEEFRMLESALAEQASQEPADSFVNTTLLCELRIGGAKRYEGTDVAATKIATRVPANHAQQFYAFREHLRAHLASAPAASTDDAPQTHSSSIPFTKRSTTCLREVDESLDDAVRCTSSSSIAVHRASSMQQQQHHRRGASLRATGASALFGARSAVEGSLFPPTSSHRVAQQDGDQLCDRITGDLGKTCAKPRPCPFHDATGH